MAKRAKHISLHWQDFPRCAKCEMPVEEFYLLERDNNAEFVIKCHNKVERVLLTADTLIGLDTATIQIGIAFTEDKP